MTFMDEIGRLSDTQFAMRATAVTIAAIVGCFGLAYILWDTRPVRRKKPRVYKPRERRYQN